MDKFEMIEKLSAKTGVTYDEAKEALEKSDCDILDALVLLEKQGKVKSQGAAYSTQKKPGYDWSAGARGVKEDVGNGISRLWDWLKRMVRKGNRNLFVISRKGEELVAVPVTVLVIMLVLLPFWPLLLLFLFAGLFLQARYSFRGPDIGSGLNDAISRAQEKAASAVQSHRDDDSRE